MNENLFSLAQQQKQTQSASNSGAPLAERMRPQRLDDYFGQEDLIGPNSPLRKSIEEDRIQSFILWGPPGTGKTTLARIIALHTNREFIILSAVMSGVKDIKDAVQYAKDKLSYESKRTIVFVDEIHRFNKSQQDALLPHVENGTITLIGATTENPSFELNSALLSRAPVYVLKSLNDESIRSILFKSLEDPVRGLGSFKFELKTEWLEKIVSMANGDARKALTLLERVVYFFHSFSNKEMTIENFEKALGSKVLRYDSKGEEHYNTISAFIKSLRDSDPDAALYYCARMLEAGEDPLFIARRMVIFASEDIGNADPRALQIALNVKDAVDFVGMPEARINLAQAVTFLASSAKSNASYMGIENALSEVRNSGNLEIPKHILNAPTKLMKNLGYGKDYKYAHSQDAGFSGMSNLPEQIKNTTFYEPKESGLEKQIKEKIDLLRAKRKN